MTNTLSVYRDKFIKKELAVSIAIKFAMQEHVFQNFLEEIKKFKPYQKGNDNPRVVMNYAVGYCITMYLGQLNNLFRLPSIILGHYNWDDINNRWNGVVGNLQIKSNLY